MYLRHIWASISPYPLTYATEVNKKSAYSSDRLTLPKGHLVAV